MRNLLIAIAMGCALTLPVVASETSVAPAASAAAAMSQGEVRKIDVANQKITLRHGPLVNLGMPPMTMVFGVQEPGLLDGLKVGDKVQFVVEQKGSQFVVTELQSAQ
ncbi:copper-binding protein [Pseudomonas sp.]|uniref:copper-binding protein n=1 Tax=Pseudomonas sp. TaxID=306 RepID=UPI0027327C35|nr:copper-binding protein [Pseudomonas sp.]MDP3816160.1 copper-binding protein [Pseudomonas sp.]